MSSCPQRLHIMLASVLLAWHAHIVVTSNDPLIMQFASHPTMHAVHVNSPSLATTSTTGYPVTYHPTKNPTVDPSPVPTNSPTHPPTQRPTRIPSSSPTPAPTAKPTRIPTRSPSLSPSFHPTRDPTNAPTSSPSFKPTMDPTMVPTDDPTMFPTVEPTVEPTTEPTTEPTVEPTTMSPTAVTLSPTAMPTASPVITYNLDTMITVDFMAINSSDTTLLSIVVHLLLDQTRNVTTSQLTMDEVVKQTIDHDADDDNICTFDITVTVPDKESAHKLVSLFQSDLFEADLRIKIEDVTGNVVSTQNGIKIQCSVVSNGESDDGIEWLNPSMYKVLSWIVFGVAGCMLLIFLSSLLRCCCICCNLCHSETDRNGGRKASRSKSFRDLKGKQKKEKKASRMHSTQPLFHQSTASKDRSSDKAFQSHLKNVSHLKMDSYQRWNESNRSSLDITVRRKSSEYTCKSVMVENVERIRTVASVDDPAGFNGIVDSDSEEWDRTLTVRSTSNLNDYE